MTVSNRALTLATRGLLTGAAITIATNGLIQLPIAEAGSDSFHSHTSTATTIQQHHKLNVLDSFHSHISDAVTLAINIPIVLNAFDSYHSHNSGINDFVKVAPPIVLPPVAAAPRGGADRFIIYGVPYTFNSVINLRVVLDSDYSFKRVESSDYINYSNPRLIVYSRSNSYKAAYHQTSIYPSFNVESLTTSRFSEIAIRDVKPTVVIESNHGIEFTAPALKHIDLESSVELVSETDSEFFKADAPVPIINNINVFDKSTILILSVESNSEFKTAELNDHIIESNFDAILDIVTSVDLESETNSIKSFNSDSDLSLKSNSEYSFTSGEPEEDFEEELLLMLVAVATLVGDA